MRDNCSRAGAERLRRRIIEARQREGVPIGNLVIVNTGARFAGRIIYGVREWTPPAPLTPVKVKLTPRTEPVWYSAAKKICAAVLKDHPHVELDVILEGAGKRASYISAARRACIRAVHDAGIANCRTGLAQFFRIDQSSISLAVNRDGRRKDRESQQVAA